MCAKVFCIMYENLWILPRTSVNNLRANWRTHQPTHTHRYTHAELFVSATGIRICIWCVTTNLQWHLHWQLSVYLAVCLSLSLSLLLLSSCLPLPLPTACLPVHVLVAAEQSLRSNGKQNKFINFPVKICAVFTALVSPSSTLSPPLSISLSTCLSCSANCRWRENRN